MRPRHLFAMRLLSIWILLLLSNVDAALIPLPQRIVEHEGAMVVDFQTGVIAPAQYLDQAKLVQAALTRMTTSTHYCLTERQAGRMRYQRAIRLKVEQTDPPASYRLEVRKDALTIIGSDSVGLAYGVQTLIQLLKHPSKPIQRMSIPCQTIDDVAAVNRRIFHLNVSGHLFSTQRIKELVDWLAFHKINEFHLGLNDDYGWRMESLRFPKLHEIGSVRASTPPYGNREGSDKEPYGGYYTQANLREIVSYAKARKVTVVPVFSFSQGASPILAAYPHLGESSEEVKSIWKDWQVGVPEGEEQSQMLCGILEEALHLFPDGIRLIDGEKRLDELRLFLQKKKSQLISGAEVVTDLSLYGLNEKSELLTDKNREAFPGLNTLQMLYQLEAQSSMEARLTTEYVHDEQKLQYQLFPRIAAFAEAGWRAAAQRDDQDFLQRLRQMLERYEVAGLKPSAINEEIKREAIDGTKVTTTMSLLENHWPELSFDGKEQTSFRANSATAGDVLTFEFLYPIEGMVFFETGDENESDSLRLIEGVAESSMDGREWKNLVSFQEGKASLQAPKHTRFLRLRVTGDQDQPFVLKELRLAEAVLVPKLEEVRELRIPKGTGEPVDYDRRRLIFAVDFTDHPELRDQIAAMRRMYFQSWYRVVDQLGVFYDPRTNLRFELDLSEIKPMSVADAQDELLKQMIAHLQQYRADSPKWLRSGMEKMLRYQLVAQSTWAKSFGVSAKSSEALSGGDATAAFFLWVSEVYGGAVLQAISQDCSRGGYRKEIWQEFTRKSFEEVLAQYQKRS